MIRHYRGLESAYNPSTHGDGLYFATDTHKIIHNGNTYGMDVEEIADTFVEVVDESKIAFDLVPYQQRAYEAELAYYEENHEDYPYYYYGPGCISGLYTDMNVSYSFLALRHIQDIMTEDEIIDMLMESNAAYTGAIFRWQEYSYDDTDGWVIGEIKYSSIKSSKSFSTRADYQLLFKDPTYTDPKTHKNAYCWTDDVTPQMRIAPILEARVETLEGRANTLEADTTALQESKADKTEIETIINEVVGPRFENVVNDVKTLQKEKAKILPFICPYSEAVNPRDGRIYFSTEGGIFSSYYGSVTSLGYNIESNGTIVPNKNNLFLQLEGTMAGYLMYVDGNNNLVPIGKNLDVQQRLKVVDAVELPDADSMQTDQSAQSYELGYYVCGRSRQLWKVYESEGNRFATQIQSEDMPNTIFRTEENWYLLVGNLLIKISDQYALDNFVENMEMTVGDLFDVVMAHDDDLTGIHNDITALQEGKVDLKEADDLWDEVQAITERSRQYAMVSDVVKKAETLSLDIYTSLADIKNSVEEDGLALYNEGSTVTLMKSKGSDTDPESASVTYNTLVKGVSGSVEKWFFIAEGASIAFPIANNSDVDSLSAVVSKKADILSFNGISSIMEPISGYIYNTQDKVFYKYIDGNWHIPKGYNDDFYRKANPRNLYRYNGDYYYIGSGYNLYKIADTTTMETALATKANESDVQDVVSELVNQISDKADSSDLNSLADLVVDLQEVVEDNTASIEDLRKVDDVRIYCRRNDGVTYDYFVPLYDWNETKANTYVPEGVAIMTPGKVLIVALTESASTLPLKPSSISGNYKPTEGTNTNSTGTAIADLDGRGNTNALMTVSQFTGEGTMVNYCNTYATEHLPAGTWWVPSIGELMVIGAHFREINYALSLISGATQITTSLYASSTMKDYSYWVYNIYQGMIAEVGPTASRNCRAVTTLQ